MKIELDVEPTKTYTLAEAHRLSPIHGYQTFRRYADQGKIKAKRNDNGQYSVSGADLIEFIKSLNKNEKALPTRPN